MTLPLFVGGTVNIEITLPQSSYENGTPAGITGCTDSSSPNSKHPYT